MSLMIDTKAPARRTSAGSCCQSVKHCHSVTPRLWASCVMRSIVVRPIPRGGWLMTRSRDVSSGFDNNRRYAVTSLTSARSKNRRPP